MKSKILFFFLSLTMAFTAFANTTPDNPGAAIDKAKSEIQAQLSDLDALDKTIISEGLNYDQLNAKHGTEVKAANLAASEEDGIFKATKNAPAGIPGFFWGFCLGLVGTLIIFLTMDDGSDRKTEIMNSIWGIVALIGLWAIYVVVTLVLSRASIEPAVPQNMDSPVAIVKAA